MRLIAARPATGQIRAEVDPDAAARTLIAVFQGLVLQVAWGEDVDLAACGPLIRDMIRGRPVHRRRPRHAIRLTTRTERSLPWTMTDTLDTPRRPDRRAAADVRCRVRAASGAWR